MPEKPKEKPKGTPNAPQQAPPGIPQQTSQDSADAINAVDAAEYKAKILDPKVEERDKEIGKLLGEKTEGDEGTERLRDQVAFKFKTGIHMRFKKALEYKSAQKRKELLDQAEKEVKTYMDTIEAFVYKVAKRDADPHLNEKELYELLKLAESVPKNFLIPEKHRDLILRAIRSGEKGLDQKELKELASLVKPMQLGSNFENLECAPVGAAIAMLSPAQRFEVARMVMDRNPDTVRQWVTMMVASGVLTIAQGEQLWDYAGKRGYTKSAFSAKEMTALRENIMQTVERKINWTTKDDTNPALKMLTLGKIGAFAGAVWGGFVFALNAVVGIRSGNLEGLATYGALGLGAMAGGVKVMTGKWPAEDFLKSGNAEEKEKSAITAAEERIMNILGENPNLTRYLRAGGYATIRMALHKRAVNNQPLEFTFEDLKALETDGTRREMLGSLEKNWPDTAIKNMREIAGISARLQELAASHNAETKPDAKAGARQIAELTAIMGWRFDPKSPADSQTRFNSFYNTYAKKYGLS